MMDTISVRFFVIVGWWFAKFMLQDPDESSLVRCEVTSAAGAGNKSCAASNGAGDMIKNRNMTRLEGC